MVPKNKEKERNGTKKVLAEISVHSYSGGGKEEGSWETGHSGGGFESNLISAHRQDIYHFTEMSN